ncbi:hypothetical protein ASE80_03730 [Pseudomonas sp. Leaf15]|nr:hypothetical protein ASE80_03730 [Pseudomonas sp. Leaf15]
MGKFALAAMALQTETSATQPIPCGSCRAPARLRKRWVRQLNFACATAFAASLGLDSSHIGALSLGGIVYGAMALRTEI